MRCGICLLYTSTFKRHMKIAKGVLNEDDYLLQEILFNPRTPAQVEGIRTELNELLDLSLIHI